MYEQLSSFLSPLNITEIIEQLKKNKMNFEINNFREIFPFSNFN